MKNKFLVLLTLMALACALANNGLTAQVTITEEPDLSADFSNPHQYQEMYRDIVSEKYDEVASNQIKNILIFGGVAAGAAVIVVLLLSRTPKKKRRRW